MDVDKRYEYDVTYWGILLFEKLGLVRNLRGIRKSAEMDDVPAAHDSVSA